MTDVVREALEAAADFIQREADLRDASAFAETDPYIAEPRAQHCPARAGGLRQHAIETPAERLLRRVVGFERGKIGIEPVEWRACRIGKDRVAHRGIVRLVDIEQREAEVLLAGEEVIE